MQTRAWLAVALGILGLRSAIAAEDIEFVAEHLPEVAMDDRYAALPFGAPAECADRAPWQVSAGYLDASAGGLAVSGPMFGLAYTLRLSSRWQLTTFGFVDDLSFDGHSNRPLAPDFSTAIPLALPAADAAFTNLGGSALDFGIGAVLKLHGEGGWLGSHDWMAGLLVQRMALDDYTADYRIESGPDAGITGTIDFSSDYDFVTPVAGLATHYSLGDWSLHPRLLVAVPLPHQPVYGRITGPGFDLAGDTAATGLGKHFGDPSLTVGLGLTYEPYGLTLDLGSTLTQALLEPKIHEGIDQNWMLSLECAF